MHDGQLEIDAPLARMLIAARFPEWADAAVLPVTGAGTVNRIFRVGETAAARFPLLPESVEVLQAEAEALSAFAERSPVAAPRPLGIGQPDARYPSAWAVQTWVAGDVADPVSLQASDRFADGLAALIRALRAMPTGGRGFDGRGRGGVLADHDDWVAHCIAQSSGLVDTTRVAALWRMLREMGPAAELAMSHRDLTPPNLLVADGRLVGVLDGGAFGPADPALDLVAAWHLLDADRRNRLRRGLGMSTAVWLLGAGWALQQAMGLIWYYPATNPPMAQLGRTTMARLLDDEELSGLAHSVS